MTPESATQLRDYLLPLFQQETPRTLRILQALPQESFDFKPHEKSMSMGTLAWHICKTEKWYINSMGEGKFDPPPTIAATSDVPATFAEIVEAYERNTPENIATLGATDGESLAKVLNFQGFIKLPAVLFLQLVINHTIHHRAQLTVYLRLVDAFVPSTYGPSADELPIELQMAQKRKAEREG